MHSIELDPGSRAVSAIQMGCRHRVLRLILGQVASVL